MILLVWARFYYRPKTAWMHMGSAVERVQPHQGVRTLVGNPRKAIMALAWPMMFAQSVQIMYNLIGAFWVSGLGANALSAVGFFLPFYLMTMALATGLGTGGGSAIARSIGMQDKEKAGRVATHTMMFMLVMSLVMTVPLLFFSRSIFQALGAGPALGETVAYGRIMFSGIIIIFFVNVSNALLWGEGDAKRAMKAMMLGAIINMILDPVMIYGLGLGVPGAAWATLIALSITASMLFYWLFIEKHMYSRFNFKGFRFNRVISKDIFKVGLPASVQQLTMSINTLILNLIIVSAFGVDGVAVLTTGWRISTLGILPLIGISTAVISVCGAAYGMGKYRKMDVALHYAIKVGLVIEIVLALSIFILAGPITAVFTQSRSAAVLAPDLHSYFRITCLFLPGVSLGMLSGSMFQGAGKGLNALLVTIVRTVVLTPPLAYGLAIVLGMGLDGVWWGLVIANVTGSIIAYSWARYYIHGLRKPTHAAGLKSASAAP
jgi:putative MATE family efflux protein